MKLLRILCFAPLLFWHCGCAFDYAVAPSIKDGLRFAREDRHVPLHKPVLTGAGYGDNRTEAKSLETARNNRGFTEHVFDFGLLKVKHRTPLP